MKVFTVLLLAVVLSSCGFNSGGKWKPTSIQSKEHHMFDNYFSDGIVFVVVSGENIYALTQEAGMYISIDEGATWTKTKLNGIPDTIKINDIVVSGNKMVAGTRGAGVFISEDNGKNWKPANNGLFDTTAYKLYCAQSVEKENKEGYWKKSYAGYSDSAKLYNQTMSEFRNPDFKKYITNTLQVSSIAISGKNLYAYLPYAIFSSTDNGKNWTKVSVGERLLKSGNPVALAGGKENIFAYCGSELQRSKDNGKTWKKLHIEIPPDTAYVGEGGIVQYGDKTIETIVINGKTIYAGTNNGVFVSIDEGDHWKAINNGLPNTKRISALAVSGKTLFVSPGDYMGVFVSNDNGENWKEFNNGFRHNTKVDYNCGYITYFALSKKNIYAGVWTNGQCPDALWVRSLEDAEE
ncbi:MAG: hypothetical protein Q8M29_01740 [Bacteroidota bacterium]|nr:hypothetical protein [Bacteroidota bacterium]